MFYRSVDYQGDFVALRNFPLQLTAHKAIIRAGFSVVANLRFSRTATSHFLTRQAVPRQFTCNAFLRSLAPQHGGYKDVDADDIYTRP